MLRRSAGWKARSAAAAISIFAPLLSAQILPGEAVARAERALAALTSFQADFEQNYFSMTVSTPLREKGRLFYQKPGRMRWDYQEPKPQTIVLQDNFLQTYDPEENLLIRQRLAEDQQGVEIFGLLTGQGGLAERYLAEKSPFPGAEGPVHQVKLTPKEEGETEYILLEIDAKTFLLRRVILFDWAGNKNEFAFSRLKANPSLAPGLFELKVPPGCEIIDDAPPRKR